MYASSLYSWYCIHGLNQIQIVYNTVVFTINTKKKITHVSGPTHFKPMLFKVQLYLIPFSLPNNTSLYGYISHFAYPFINGWMDGSFSGLGREGVIPHNATINICVHIFG